MAEALDVQPVAPEPGADAPFISTGTQTSTIPVTISYRIIELFSEGLYSSPHKAIEELVANAFDAGATTVHVILSPDRTAPGASITVIDNGESMDDTGLRQHWVIGKSKKRELASLPKGRKQIGKFGIGKLSTFVLARFLTHICKRGAKYYATTMDYAKIPHGADGGIEVKESVTLPLRELTAAEAKNALVGLVMGEKPGYKALPLFGKGAPANWTVAVMSGLKEMAGDIKKGTLSWVLRTAMPLRDDFALYLDGDKLLSSKLDTPPIKRWVLGKDLVELPKPAPDDLEQTEDARAPAEHKFGLTHRMLGRITGYIELYQDFLTEGKAAEIGRSHGFFVYVLGRLVNLDDPLFGMEPLRHGTFARFRMVVHIDRLDEELRSSRENLRHGALLTTAQNVLHGAFNHARNWLEEYDAKQKPGTIAALRIGQSPGSLTRRPILGLVRSVFDGKAAPRLLEIPSIVRAAERKTFIQDLEARVETGDRFFERSEFVELAQNGPIAVFDVKSGVLKLNALHPFVVANCDSFEAANDTVVMFAMAEVLTEAYLYQHGLDESLLQDVMANRDELLRHFARSKKRNANMVAQDLLDASSDEDRLEIELVAAFESMGFGAVRIGGKGKPDGRAEAQLASQGGVVRRYAVVLEAKSKEKPGAKVSARTVSVSTVAQHRKAHSCDHAIVVGPDFPTKDNSNLVKQIESDKQSNPGKTITLMRIADLARLVRLVPIKYIGLDRIRTLFQTCVTVEQAATWVEALAKEKRATPPYLAILETIWELQGEAPSEAVEYAGVVPLLRRRKKPVSIKKEELIELCKLLSQIAPQVVVRDNTVELTLPPAKIMEAAGATIQDYPEDLQKETSFKL